MHIDIIPNRNSKPTYLLRETYREGKKVIKRTLANLSKLPPNVVSGLSILLAGGKALPAGEDPIVAQKTLPHGHVAAVLGVMKELDFDRFLTIANPRVRQLVIAMVAARLLDPASKLATSGMLSPESETSTLGRMLNLGEVNVNELYAALDALYAHQPKIEQKLARRHLVNGTLVLYDLSSSYVEGHCCKLAKRGYSRDGKKGTLQIVYGLLCAPDGCPIAIEVFEGNTADPMTLSAQIDKLKTRFKLRHVVLVGDRGMITQARIEEVVKPAGFDWITALRSSAIDSLIQTGIIQMSLFEEQDMASITSPDYPDERLIACRNANLAQRRAQKREALLCATEKDLDKLVLRTQKEKRALSGADKIGLAVGKVIQKYKMEKHFELSITDNHFSYTRKQDEINREALLDGIYVVRTPVSKDEMDDNDVVLSYKRLARVERAFRTLKTSQLEIRPIYHWNTERVRGHALLCMLAYYVEWHLRKKLAPLLFDETDPEAAEALRENPVVKTKRSSSAKAKERSRRTPDDLPVLSFKGLLKHLSTYTWIQAASRSAAKHSFVMYAEPSPLQERAFELLGIKPNKM